jgi:hypothetical protein
VARDNPNSVFLVLFSQCACFIYSDTLRLQANQLTGDVTFLCDIKIADFEMDCLDGASDLEVEIDCPCCSVCCDESLARPGEIGYCRFNT